MIQKIELPRFEDGRGVFQKLFATEPVPLGDFQVKQINKVFTKQKGVLRGLHFQLGEFAEAKFFQVSRGSIQLAAFCVDPLLENYLRTESFTINEKEGGILIPKGYASGYLVLEDNSEVIYCSDNVYQPSVEKGLRWNDPLLDIKWSMVDVVLSDKDRNWEDFVNA